jgi:hypothetical protein
MQRRWRVLASPLTPSSRSHMFSDQSSDNQFTGNLVTMKLHVCHALPSLLAKEGALKHSASVVRTPWPLRLFRPEKPRC